MPVAATIFAVTICVLLCERHRGRRSGASTNHAKSSVTLLHDGYKCSLQFYIYDIACDLLLLQETI